MSLLVLQVKSQRFVEFFEKYKSELEESDPFSVKIHGKVSIIQSECDWISKYPKLLSDIVPAISGILTNYEVYCKDDLDNGEYPGELKEFFTELFDNAQELEATIEKAFFGDFDDSLYDNEYEDEDDFEDAISSDMTLNYSFFFNKESGVEVYESGEKGSEYQYQIID